MRKWSWAHPLYWTVEIDESFMQKIKQNFDNDVVGYDIVVDENHEPNAAAMGWYRELYIQNWNMYAEIECTAHWAELLNRWMYKYFSPEFTEGYQDDETLINHWPVLTGWAFTNKPYFNNMEELKEASRSEAEADAKIFYFVNPKQMEKRNEEMEFSEETQETASEEENEEVENTEESDDWETEKETTEEEADDEEVEEEEKEPEPVEQYSKKDDVIQMSKQEYEKLKNQAKEFNKLLHEKKKFNIQQKLENYKFNAETGEGVVTPKMESKILEFASQLSDSKEKEFFSILWDIQGDLSEKFSEVGHGEEDTEEWENEAEKMSNYIETRKQEYINDGYTNYEAIKFAQKDYHRANKS